MILTMILIVFNLIYAGRALERMITTPDGRTWMDWLEFGFWLFMGLYLMVAMVGQASGVVQ